MSVEALVIAAAVEEGNLKKVLQAGVSGQDFPIYEEEFEWLIAQTDAGHKINWRRFQNAFPDFERLVPKERLQELCEELKRESGYNSLVAAIDQVAENLSPDNFIAQTEFMREITGDILRSHSPINDVLLSEHKSYLVRIKALGALREVGNPAWHPDRDQVAGSPLGWSSERSRDPRAGKAGGCKVDPSGEALLLVIHGWQTIRSVFT
jgi:hypothetical protein